MEGKKFEIEFDSQVIHYIATAHHVLELSHEDLVKYNIRENSFLIHRFTGNAFHSFELWVDEDRQWHNNGNALIITPEIADIIRTLIDNQSN